MCVFKVIHMEVCLSIIDNHHISVHCTCQETQVQMMCNTGRFWFDCVQWVWEANLALHCDLPSTMFPCHIHSPFFSYTQSTQEKISLKNTIMLKYWDLLGPHAAHGLQVEHNWSQVLDLSFLTEIVYVIDPQQMLLVHLFCMAAKWTKTFLIRQLTFQVYDFSSTNELFYQLTLILPT